MNIIKESHVHPGISKDFLVSLPSAEAFKIQVIDSDSEGLDACIATDEESAIYWMRRGDRPNLSRMVVGEAVSTNKIVVIEGDEKGEIVLFTAYYGREVADQEPFEADWTEIECDAWVKANPDSFWANNALVEEN